MTALIHTARPASTSRNRHRIVTRESGLRAIHQPSVDLCVWRRDELSPFAGWFDRIAREGTLEVDELTSLERLPITRWLASLPDDEGRAALAEDIVGRAQTYGALFGHAQGRVQLHIVRHQHCPRFHVDNVGVRLICTWAGPATQWLPERSLDRATLRTCASGAVPARPGHTFETLARFDVALMKGCAWKGNARFGLVHRSPMVTTQPRLVLTIDGKR